MLFNPNKQRPGNPVPQSKSVTGLAPSKSLLFKLAQIVQDHQTEYPVTDPEVLTWLEQMKRWM